MPCSLPVEWPLAGNCESRDSEPVGQPGSGLRRNRTQAALVRRMISDCIGKFKSLLEKDRIKFAGAFQGNIKEMH